MIKICEKIDCCSFCDELGTYLVVEQGFGLKWAFLCDFHRLEYAGKRLKL